jgi:hypothetical protein
LNDKSMNIFHNEFIPHIIKWGRSLNLLGVVLCFGPVIALAAMGIFPPWDAFAAGMAMQLPLVFSAYIYEPISYFAVLGIPGSYMAFLSGNISNLRVPASSVAQAAAKVEEGTEEGTMIATVGIAVSIFINIAILTVGVLVGSYIISNLSDKMIAALNLLLPALFAALLVNFISQKVKLAYLSLPLSLAAVVLQKIGFFNFLPSALARQLPILICVFGTMAIGIALAKKGKLE